MNSQNRSWKNTDRYFCSLIWHSHRADHDADTAGQNATKIV